MTRAVSFVVVAFGLVFTAAPGAASAQEPPPTAGV